MNEMNFGISNNADGVMPAAPALTLKLRRETDIKGIIVVKVTEILNKVFRTHCKIHKLRIKSKSQVMAYYTTSAITGNNCYIFAF